MPQKPAAPFFRFPREIREALRPLARHDEAAQTALREASAEAARARQAHLAAIDAVIMATFPDPAVRKNLILDIGTYSLTEKEPPRKKEIPRRKEIPGDTD